MRRILTKLDPNFLFDDHCLVRLVSPAISSENSNVSKCNFLFSVGIFSPKMLMLILIEAKLIICSAYLVVFKVSTNLQIDYSNLQINRLFPLQGIVNILHHVLAQIFP